MPGPLPSRAIAAVTLALLAGPAAAADTICTVTAQGRTIDGPCDFSPRKGGSFTIGMTDGRLMGGARALSLDLGGGAARVSATQPDGSARSWGPARRDADDPACWAGDGFRLCARATGSGEARASGRAAVEQAEAPLPGDRVRFIGRCHMDSCSWVEQTGAHQVGEGSAAVPGRLMSVSERWAYKDYPNADYPDSVPQDARWNAAAEVRYFCSTARPAFRTQEGTWTVLPLPDVFGATEAITNAYLHVCHPDRAGGDPYEAVNGLGYKGGGAAGGESFADFAALIRR